MPRKLDLFVKLKFGGRKKKSQHNKEGVPVRPNLTFTAIFAHYDF